MKLLLISAGLCDKRTGGIPIYVNDLLLSVIKKDIQVTYLDVTGQDPSSSEAYYTSVHKPEGYEHVTFYNTGQAIDFGNGTLEPLSQVADPDGTFTQLLSQWLEGCSFDLAHIHEFIGFPIAAFQSFRERGIRLLATLHDYYTLCPTIKLDLPHQEACNLSEQDLRCKACCRKGEHLKLSYLEQQIQKLIQIKGLSWIPGIMGAKIVRGGQTVLSLGVKAQAYRDRRRLFIQHLSQFDHLMANSVSTLEVFKSITSLPNLRHDPSFTCKSIHTSPPESPKVRKATAQPLRILLLNIKRPQKGLTFIKTVLEILPPETAKKIQVHLWGSSIITHSSVVNHPSYTHEDLDAICQQADIGCTPSMWRETFGFSCAEMLSRGLPVLCPNHGAIREHIQNGKDGMLFDHNDPEAFVELLETLLQNPALIIQLQEGAEMAWRKFPKWETHVDLVSDHYRDLV